MTGNISKRRGSKSWETRGYDMKRLVWAAAAVLLVTTIGVALAEESTIGTYIRDLKSEDADVRAKAAYELGCG